MRYRGGTIRLPGYDYGKNGAYFVTICTKDRVRYFGNIIVERSPGIPRLKPTQLGITARTNWIKIPEHFPFVTVDEFIIMPDHIHGILIINKISEPQYLRIQSSTKSSYQNRFGPQSKNLSSIIRGYKASIKTFATKNNFEFEWLPRFYEHIIRNEGELNRIRQYIINNPKKWHQKDKKLD
jgi:putative transposase